jgi:pimeloyl-ACP methyl ester carboxylesterase
VGAIVASLEADFRFIALLAPMVNTVHALYEGPTSWAIRGQLMRAGLEPTLIDRHAHLSSPFHAPPAGDTANRTLIVGGAYDHIVRVSDLMALREAWKGSEFVTLPQGHFGYGMIPRAFVWLRERDLLSPS